MDLDAERMEPEAGGRNIDGGGTAVLQEMSDAELLAAEPEFSEGTQQSEGDNYSSSKTNESNQTGHGMDKASCSGHDQSSVQLAVSGNGSDSQCEGSSFKRRRRDSRIPLERFDRKYLSVTDLSQQAWCEQQVVYGMEMPHIQRLRDEHPVVQTGSSIHLARELEIQDIVPINIQCQEDSWGVKLLNFLSMIQFLQAGERVRELPVFGEVEGIFLVGVIDELCYNSSGELELHELKTRSQPTLPHAAQRKSHHLQVSVYKLLFEALIKGQLNKDAIIHHLHLQTERSFSSEVMAYAQMIGLSVNTFGDLLDLIFLNLMYAEIPTVDILKIEYCYQADASVIGTEVVFFEEEWVKKELKYYCSFWKGQREAKGVDIEEAWKCRRCDFADICQWRKKKAEEAAEKNQANHRK